ncbi:N-glycosylase/DNA lyase [Trichostrongylus colubriformis]|uniref:DNA-(apurinic or apyrimidinic site) lyase n=1 Tax=Trichostrongylus colubriformis TaxID=6319 RepID=A0AAN8F8F1_TRICO
MPFVKLPVTELNLRAILLNGQSFRWRNIDRSFYGVVDGLLLYLRHDDEKFEWDCLGRAASAVEIDISRKVHDYFQLDIAMETLWEDWVARDSLMADLRKVKELQGIRILNQDPLETLLAFICSSNNNIPRISSMVNKLAKLYGEPIVVDPLEDEHGKKVLACFPELGYAFPTLSKLTTVQDKLENVLREQLFGYRAKSVSETVKQLSQLPSTCLMDVQDLEIDEIRQFLLRFAGVAECVALMSLGQHQCVPIDRHVFDITKKYYIPSLRDTKLSNALSRRLMEFYEDKFGKYAGWAQAVLFNQQLEKFVHAPLMELPVKAPKNGKVLKKGRGRVRGVGGTVGDGSQKASQ